MTPRERVERALRGGRADRVPFTMYEGFVLPSAAEREMRNRGLCIVQRRVHVHKSRRPNVKTTREVSWEGGQERIRTVHRTPVGTVSELVEPAGSTTWTKEYLFKSPEDYKTLCFLIEDEVFEPNYGAFAQAERDFGGDAFLWAELHAEPLQHLYLYWMGPETYCLEWMDNRDEILALYEAMSRKHRELFRLAADSPAWCVHYGENVVPEMIGRENFEQYHVANYNEAAEILHPKGKIVGAHFDANCRLLAPAIAGCGLDYVEAFTPAPGTDMTLAEARAAWPDKALWLNFPSALHLQPDGEVCRAAFDLLEELDSIDGVLMGITEDIPPHRWQDSCRAIMDGLDRHAAERQALYAPSGKKAG
ncbi:MAG: hypothetical protein V1918_01505 [Planctomycetota bacterium]